MALIGTVRTSPLMSELVAGNQVLTDARQKSCLMTTAPHYKCLIRLRNRRRAEKRLLFQQFVIIRRGLIRRRWQSVHIEIAFVT